MAQFKKTNTVLSVLNSKPLCMLLCLFIISFSPLKLFAEKPYQYRALPKSGTHLIAKSLYLLTGRKYGASHFTNYDKLIHIPQNERTIVHVRDLRDVFVALMKNCDEGAANILAGRTGTGYRGIHRQQPQYRHIHENWLQLSTEDKLSALINLQDDLLPYPAGCIVNNVITADLLINESLHGRRAVLVTKFENLVGCQGGATMRNRLKS